MSGVLPTLHIVVLKFFLKPVTHFKHVRSNKKSRKAPEDGRKNIEKVLMTFSTAPLPWEKKTGRHVKQVGGCFRWLEEAELFSTRCDREATILVMFVNVFKVENENHRYLDKVKTAIRDGGGKGRLAPPWQHH